MNVVKLHDGRPPLNDVPARLKLLVEQIEAGELVAETAFVIIPVKDEFPRLFGFGNVDGRNDPLIQTDLLRHWLITNLIERT